MTRTLRVTLVATLAIAFLAVGVSELRKASRSIAIPPPPPSVESTRDDPDARSRWEMARLVDPATGRLPANIHRDELAFARQLPTRDSFGKTQTSAWERRGPINVGGRTRALAYDMSDSDVILAGGVSGGIWRSDDGGASWSKSTAPAQLHSVTTIVQDADPDSLMNWYAGTGEYSGNSASGSGASYSGDGVFKSTDGGMSWDLLPSLSGFFPATFNDRAQYTWELAVDAVHGYLYVATYDQLLRSDDGGASFNLELGGATFSSYTDVVTTSTGNAYAAFSLDAGASGIWENTTGMTAGWTNITPSGYPSSYRRQELAVSPQNEDHVWLIAYTPGGGQNDHSLWQYDASTMMWTDYTTLLPSAGGLTGNFTSQGGYDLLIAVHPDDDNIIFIGGTNLYRIDVTGATATWIGGYTPANNSYALYPNHHPDQHALAFNPDDADIMLSGSDGGVRGTTNNLAPGNGGVTWASKNSGYYTSQFYTLCINSNGSDPTIAGGLQDNGTWSTASLVTTDNWVEEWGGDGADCAIADRVLLPGKTKWISAQQGALTRKLYNNGGSLTSWVSVYPVVHGGVLFIHPFVLDPSDANVLYFPAVDTVGPDGGTVWRASSAETAGIGTGWTDMELSGVPTTITAISVSESNPANVLYLGTNAGTVHRLEDADTASPPAAPEDITGGSFASGGTVSDIAINPMDADEVLVVFSNYGITSIFHTDDGGDTWQDVEGNLAGAAGPSVRTAAIMPGTGSPFIVGTSTGLYSASTMNGGSTVWMQEAPTQIGNVVVDRIRGRSSDGFIAVATHAAGVFSIEVSLSVELATFDAAGGDGTVSFAWTTASEQNNRGFSIQYRGLAEDDVFQELAFVEGAGNSNANATYRHTAELVPGNYRFRLKQIDLNGTFVFSDEVDAAVDVPGELLLSEAYPNPFADRAAFSVSVKQTQDVTVTVFDAAGRQVRKLHEGSLEGGMAHEFAIDGSDLAAGLYLYTVQTESSRESRSLVLVR